MRALVTGFGPFLAVQDNASGLLAQRLDGRRLGAVEIVGRVLPVSFADATEGLSRLIAEMTPDLVVSTGVWRGRGARLERYARNQVASLQPDVDGIVAVGRRIAPGAPERLETALPVDAWAAALDGDALHVCASENAGGYVCNAVYFALLRAMAVGDSPAIFLHVPPVTTSAALDAAEELVCALVTRSAARLAGSR